MTAPPAAAIARSQPKGRRMPPAADDAQPAEAMPAMLSPWTYRSEEFTALEIEHLFRRQWLLAGHVSDLTAAGDCLTFEAGGESALVVRGADNQLRAFHNVCRHRGARLVDSERGRCPNRITCPFHGWTYGLDGQLRGVPAAATFDGLDRAAIHLAPLRMEVWHGFLFVRFAGDGPSVAQAMRPVDDLLAPHRLPDIEPLPGARFRERRPCNWKVIHDVDNEGYHVPVGHPQLQELYGDNYRDDWVGGVSVSFARLNETPGHSWSVRHYQKLLPDFAHLPPAHRRLWFYVGIFPSTVLAIYPEGLEFYMSIPLSADATRFVGGGYALPDPRREVRAARYLGARINRAADREDAAFARRLQDGMQSSAFPAPRLSSIERGVPAFHEQIRRILPVASLAAAPPPGEVARLNAEMGG
ncbi:MAG: aromatic ring-hydroxylating dioxygenase subunit alpha [Gammaproteobacteria bacterium]|nr:aromatic ring-hydroxylating dioxygenase subunit alpha [Gammaproteobacteria bacterium]